MKHVQIYENFEIVQEKKWIQKAKLKKGALHKSLGIAKGEEIPMEKINSEIDRLHKKEELTKKESKLLKRLNLAKTLKTKVNK